MRPYRHAPWGPSPWHGPRGSYFGRGNVKFVVLELLREKPRHGYDIIREMEERSGGMYSPRPGVIYPTLQALEDQDFVKAAEQDGKKVYSITDAGLAYLQGHHEHHRHARRYAEGFNRGPGSQSGTAQGAEQGESPAGQGTAGEEGESGQPPRGEGPHSPEGPSWIHTGPHGKRSSGDWGPGGWNSEGGAAWGSWFASSGGPELMREMRWMFRDFATGIQRTLGDKEKMAEIREVLREAKTKIDEIVMR
jgi:DNA-binding PadR family transcriptional regulator